MKQTHNKFTITVPVKAYVKRFIEINYGLPADLTNDKKALYEFRKLLRKPNTRWDYKHPDIVVNYTREIEIYISEDDFYRYGWELTKTNTVAFGKYFEGNAKFFMRTTVGIYLGMGLPLNVSINKFQDRFGFDEDTWCYQTIKKDFYRQGNRHTIDFNKEIFNKLEKLFLENLYNLGT